MQISNSSYFILVLALILIAAALFLKIAIVSKFRNHFIAGLNNLFEESDQDNLNPYFQKAGIFIVLFTAIMVLSAVITIIGSLTINAVLPLIFLFLITVFLASSFTYLKNKKDFDLMSSSFRKSQVYSSIVLQKNILLKKIFGIKNNTKKN